MAVAYEGQWKLVPCTAWLGSIGAAKPSPPSPHRGCPSSPLKYASSILLDIVHRFLDRRVHQADAGLDLEAEVLEDILFAAKLSLSLNVEKPVSAVSAAHVCGSQSNYSKRLVPQ